MKNIFYILSLLFLLTACSEKKNETCGVENPLEEIPWLKEIKTYFELNMNCSKEMIIQYKYNGNDVFEIIPCYSCPDALYKVYDCEQNVICEYGGIDGVNTCQDFEENATNKKILYED